MKILLTGGGTGGHFYPIIAVAEEIVEIAKSEKLLAPTLYYMAPTPYNGRELFEHEIIYKQVSAGKIRKSKSVIPMLSNGVDMIKTGFGVLTALIQIFFIYPDVIFGKGGYASFPALLAGKILRIPVVIHESDSAPGKVNAWAGKFAARIAISYKEAAQYFPKDKVAYTGNPIRKELTHPIKDGAYEFLHLEQGIPTILILGGSQGSQTINEAMLDALPRLVEKYQIIHQTGKNNLAEVKRTAGVILEKSDHKERYHPYDYLNELAMRMSYGISDLVISRGGSTIFEIAVSGIPSIIIPIPPPTSHDQLKNAFAYARSGACAVVEQSNFSPEILVSEIERIIDDPHMKEKMSAAAKAFGSVDAAHKIAEQIIEIALSHENN